MERLHISRTDKKILGVCGGIGETFDIDPTVVRFLVASLCVVTGIIPVVVTYFLVAIVVPRKKT